MDFLGHLSVYERKNTDDIHESKHCSQSRVKVPVSFYEYAA